MRGSDKVTGSPFSYVDLEERIPARHPLRKITDIVNDALRSLDAEFDRLCAGEGRLSITLERLIRASRQQVLFSIRSERQLIEQMDYNLLFRWFVGLGIDEAVWVPTVFTKNRDRPTRARPLFRLVSLKRATCIFRSIGEGSSSVTFGPCLLSNIASTRSGESSESRRTRVKQDGAIPSRSASSAIVMKSPVSSMRFQRNARASALT